MGWTTTYRAPKQFTDLQWFQQRFGQNLIDGATVNTTFYGVWEITPDERIALVVLIDRYTKDPEYNFGWKEMDETMGPNADQCPAKILSQLSPTTNAYALKWRERCQKNIERRSHLKTGAVFKTAEPMRFSDGVSDDLFRITCRKGRRTIWQRNVDGALVKINNHSLSRMEFVS